MFQWLAEMEDAGALPGLPSSMLTLEQGREWNDRVVWLILVPGVDGRCLLGLQALLSPGSKQAGVTDLSQGFGSSNSIFPSGIWG